MVNSVDGFGGAVTAALFLEKFVKDVPWAHFDIYAWKDSADGCMLEGGGNGQTVATLALWLKSQR
jgi:leucyl aminopeptidase